MMNVHFTILLLLCFGIARAQTNVGGTITSSQNWSVAGSPYLIQGNTLIETGVTVSIGPGVQVLFTDSYYLEVRGSLVATGAPGDSIVFGFHQPSSAAALHKGIRLKSSTTVLNPDYSYVSGSRFSHCVFRNASTALYVYEGSVLLEGCAFRDNTTGFEPRRTTRSLATGCLFESGLQGIGTTYEDNSLGGDPVGCILDLWIRDCTFRNLGTGALLNMNQRTFGNLRVEDCDFRHNATGMAFGGGGYGPYAAGITFRRNLFFRNQRGLLVDQIYGMGWNGCAPAGSATGVSVTDSRFIGNTQEHLRLNQAGSFTHLVEHNLFADGPEGLVIQGSSSALVSGNQFVDILRSVRLASMGNQEPTGVTIQANLFTQPAACDAEYSIRTGTVNGSTSILSNNFIGTNGFIVRNEGPGMVQFSGNHVELAPGEQLADRILDGSDDVQYGVVQVSSPQPSPHTNVPVAGPSSVVKSPSGNGTQVSWVASPVSDVMGYLVHYGTFDGLSYSQVVNAGNTSSHWIEGADPAWEFAVTAYDNMASGEMEDFWLGHASWFRQASPPPSPPAASVIVNATPCLSGVELLPQGAPLHCLEWYWQDSPGGTSFDQPVTGPRQVYENGTYYLRTYDPVTLTWSVAGTAVVVDQIPEAVEHTLQWIDCSEAVINGETYTESGTYFQVLQTSGGCDSLLTIELTLTGVVSVQPLDAQTTEGGQVSFSVESPFANASYQWQSDIGFGFQNLTNAGQYSGVQTPTLVVSNATILNSNQLFRCLVSAGDCSGHSDTVTLTVTGVTALDEGLRELPVMRPNPAQMIVRMDVPADWMGTPWQLWDASGHVMGRGRFDSAQWWFMVADLANGHYMLCTDFGKIPFVVAR